MTVKESLEAKIAEADAAGRHLSALNQEMLLWLAERIDDAFNAAPAKKTKGKRDEDDA